MVGTEGIFPTPYKYYSMHIIDDLAIHLYGLFRCDLVFESYRIDLMYVHTSEQCDLIP